LAVDHFVDVPAEETIVACLEFGELPVILGECTPAACGPAGKEVDAGLQDLTPDFSLRRGQPCLNIHPPVQDTDDLYRIGGRLAVEDDMATDV
jgi:hypothetical protein